MGHDVIECPTCKSWIMEGRNDWECDKCGFYSAPLRNIYKLGNVEEYSKKKKLKKQNEKLKKK